MKQISLTQGYTSLVDDEDFDRLSKHRWFTKVGHGGHLYAVGHAGNNRSMTRMHRFILGEKCKDFVVDHINGNSLDNRKCNLRICEQAQNLMNQRIRKDTTTGFKGVSKRGENKYRAYITINKKQKNLGLYNCPIEAARAYDAAAKNHFQSFAKTNF